VLDGADGDDSLAGGDGADVILIGDWITPDDPTMDIVDYDQTEDQLVIMWDLSAGVPAIDVQPNEDSAEDMRAMVDGHEILRVSVVEGLSASDLVILDHVDAEALGLAVSAAATA